MSYQRVVVAVMDRFKDPHRGCEHELMKTAGKPLAYLFTHQAPPDFTDEFVVEQHWHNGSQRQLIYLPQYQYRSRLFKQTYAMYSRGLISDRTAHVRCGFLLGYTKAQIRLFLRRGERLI